MQAMPDTQQRILDSARELFFLRSYADVGIAAICERAGVNRGSLYYFYPSKQDLVLAVLDAQFNDMEGNLLSQAFAEDIPPMARLARFAKTVYQVQKQINAGTGHVLGCPFGNLATELSTQDDTIRARIQQVFRKLQGHICGVLQSAQKLGELSRDVDEKATAEAMLAYFEGVLLLAKTQNNPELIHQLLPAMAQVRITKS